MSLLINITIPVFNEAKVLENTVEQLRVFVDAHLTNRCEIVIANNGSTDDTFEVAQNLQHRHEILHVLHVVEKGRGGALKKTWGQS